MSQRLQVLAQEGDIPLKYQKRSCTDRLCIIIGVIFSSIMFILAIVLFNYDHFFKVNFPSDSDGRLCGMDEKTKGYNYVYFVDPPSIERRVCVSTCPKKEDKALNCVPTKEIGCNYQNTTMDQIVYYSTTGTGTRSGFYCFPNYQPLKQKLMLNSKLDQKSIFYNSIDVIKLSFFTSIILCLVYLVLVEFIPQIMIYAVIIIGSLVLIATVFCILFYESKHLGTKLFFVLVIACILVIVIVIPSLTYRESLNFFKTLLQISSKILRRRLIMLTYIPIFLVTLFTFMVIIVLQFTSFWTSGNLKFDNKMQLFYELQGAGPIILSILLGIQLVWGFSFIKAVFNFCISCVAVQQIFNQPHNCLLPLKLLFCKHFGSVIACSFMVGFFAPFDIVLDYLKPNRYSNPNSLSYRLYNKFCGYCGKITRFIRQDSMAYINMTGNPYCNASRYAQYLTISSQTTQNTQSISRIYRISAYLLLTGVMIIFSLYIKGQISINALYIMAVLNIFTSALFISIHCDIAQTIQISFLLKQYISNQNNEDVANVVESQRNQYHHQLAIHLLQQRQKQKNKRNQTVP